MLQGSSGNATNELFKGIISKQLPPGVTKDQVIAMLRLVAKTSSLK